MGDSGTGGSGKTAVITGASSGIGLATAKQLAARGWNVVLAARSREGLREAEAAIGSEGDAGVACVPTDVGDPEACAHLIDEAVTSFGRIDALVNNAGYAPLEPLGETTVETYEESFRINALGPAAAILRAWPVFVRQGSGCVVNVSTVGTIDPFPGFFAYASAKCAVNSMVRSIAKEGASIGVRAFAVAPAAVETPMLRGIMPESALPGEACLEPGQVASLIVSCIEGERDADNGHTIAIVRDGDGPRIDVVES
jgi:NAD(P)-dependent dehydrogenase (short-subunit alcohol dehydrogenase family)